MAIPRAVRERIGGMVWAGAWLWPLIAPAVACIQGKVPHPVLAGLGLLAFVALYLVIVTNAFDVDRLRRRGGPGAIDLVQLGALTIIGVALFVGYRNAPSGWWNIMLYVAVVGAAMFTPKIAGAWTVSVVANTVGWAIGAKGPNGPTLGDVAEIVFGTLMAGALVLVIKQMQRYIRILRDTRAELAQNAVVEERLRFARDLHDLLGHTMSLIVVKAEVVRRLVEREPALAAEAAADIEAIGRRALTEVRDAVNGYRAPEFAVELDSVRTALESAGISVRVRHDGPPVPPAASQVFGWVIREAATNVIRHSGAKVCEVTVTVDRTAAVLEIRDTGYGLRPVGGSADGVGRAGVGLVGLRERVSAAGGTLTTGNVARGGFRVLVSMPAAATPGCDTGTDRPMWAAPGSAVPASSVPASVPSVPVSSVPASSVPVSSVPVSTAPVSADASGAASVAEPAAEQTTSVGRS